MKRLWDIAFVNEAAEKEVLGLSVDLKAKFIHIAEMLLDFGPQKVGLPHVRPLEKGLWELRLKGKDNIARSIYFLSSGKRIVILHTFVKKTQKTPRKSIEIAISRRKDVQDD